MPENPPLPAPPPYPPQYPFPHPPQAFGPPRPPFPPTLGERLARAWPRPATAVPAATVALVWGAALGAALLLPGSQPGINVLLVALLLVAATVPAALAGASQGHPETTAPETTAARTTAARTTAWSPQRRVQTATVTAAVLALCAVPAVRAADWVVALCLLGALLLATVALAGGRTWRGLAAAPFALPWAAMQLPRWRMAEGRMGLALRSGVPRAVALSLLVIVLFGGLFASADQVFAGMVDAALPDLDARLLPLQIFVFTVVLVLGAAAAYVAASPPHWDDVTLKAPRRWRRTEWLMPLAVLNTMFLLFLAVQARALVGGKAYVEATTGLTYAEYARRGFWQLLAVTLLTVAVVALAARRAPRQDGRLSTEARAVLAALCGQCLLVVGSTLSRLDLYADEFGATRLRVFVSWFSLELGVVLALILVAVVLGRAAWLPRAVLASGAVALLGLAVLNPDAYIASRNVDRFESTQRLDVRYLAHLSADAVPAIARLPEPWRSQALACHRGSAADAWPGANLGRSRAREVLATLPAQAQCESYRYRTS